MRSVTPIHRAASESGNQFVLPAVLVEKFCTILHNNDEPSSAPRSSKRELPNEPEHRQVPLYQSHPVEARRAAGPGGSFCQIQNLHRNAQTPVAFDTREQKNSGRSYLTFPLSVHPCSSGFIRAAFLYAPITLPATLIDTATTSTVGHRFRLGRN